MLVVILYKAFAAADLTGVRCR